MQLLKQTLYILAFLAAFYGCSVMNSIEGDWGAIDSYGNYSELYFSDSKIEIYDEVAGRIASQIYSIKDDSLATNILSYRMDWINPDSLLLVSDSFCLKLKRIKAGLKLSDFNNEKLEDSYLNSFNIRLKAQKGIWLNQGGGTNSNQKIEEEVIEIGKKK